ncbi:hypothetical protein [Methylovulum sp.]|uniref:hypothetical protein n=1 Tax=Methylovulum sp. TaxID=1916980 RepID=UPI002605684F|nr:hypothetical protein [Methylovulum sp.]MDD5125810.1 hypothetical protein [Methylovulum sp.]
MVGIILVAGQIRGLIKLDGVQIWVCTPQNTSLIHYPLFWFASMVADNAKTYTCNLVQKAGWMIFLKQAMAGKVMETIQRSQDGRYLVKG